MNTSTSPINIKLIDWFNRSWLGIFTVKVVLMIVLEKFFPSGSVLAYILFLFLLLVTRAFLRNNILRNKKFLYTYIIGLSIFFIQIKINASKTIYFDEICLKEYILTLERKQYNSYVILNTYPNNEHLFGTTVHFDNYAKHENKYIRVSCQLVSIDSKKYY